MGTGMGMGMGMDDVEWSGVECARYICMYIRTTLSHYILHYIR